MAKIKHISSSGHIHLKKTHISSSGMLRKLGYTRRNLSRRKLNLVNKSLYLRDILSKKEFKTELAKEYGLMKNKYKFLKTEVIIIGLIAEFMIFYLFILSSWQFPIIFISIMFGTFLLMFKLYEIFTTRLIKISKIHEDFAKNYTSLSNFTNELNHYQSKNVRLTNTANSLKMKKWHHEYRTWTKSDLTGKISTKGAIEPFGSEDYQQFYTTIHPMTVKKSGIYNIHFDSKTEISKKDIPSRKKTNPSS